jgi:undecaprenyl diphosphate synthase
MHVAIIMDGNGRWAQARGLPRQAGHRVGAKAVRRVVESAAKMSVDCLSLYAFSADNWSRPREEVSHLMRLLKRYLQSEISRCAENGIRLNVIGRRDRLNPEIVRIIERAEELTANCNRMLLRIAVDYSSRDTVARSAHRASHSCTCTCNGNGNQRECFETALAAEMHATVPAGNVDLLIRSGGERRLSDFMLWESAYAELVFMDTYWPDFGEQDLATALAEFERRDRRFGGLSGPPDMSGLRAESSN